MSRLRRAAAPALGLPAAEGLRTCANRLREYLDHRVGCDATWRNGVRRKFPDEGECGCGLNDLLAQPLAAAARAEWSRSTMTTEADERRPSGLTCGLRAFWDGYVDPDGCGEPIITVAEVYRCTDCRVPFHVGCANRHFAADRAERTNLDYESEWYHKGWVAGRAAGIAEVVDAQGGQTYAAPKRKRTDWSNVVVDEGDEAP